MSPTLLALIVQIIQLAITYGPELAQEAELAISLLKSGREPSADELARISAGLDKANAALQAAIAAKS